MNWISSSKAFSYTMQTDTENISAQRQASVFTRIQLYRKISFHWNRNKQLLEQILWSDVLAVSNGMIKG